METVNKITKEQIIEHFREVSRRNAIIEDNYNEDAECDCPWKEECNNGGSMCLCDIILGTQQ